MKERQYPTKAVMINHLLGVVIKIFTLSAILSVALKYGGPYLPIPPNSISALIIVFSPAIVLGSFLWWRSHNTQKQS